MNPPPQKKTLISGHTRVGPKLFRSDIQKLRQMENAARDIYSAIYGEVNVSVSVCVDIKGDYTEK